MPSTVRSRYWWVWPLMTARSCLPVGREARERERFCGRLPGPGRVVADVVIAGEEQDSRGPVGARAAGVVEVRGIAGPVHRDVTQVYGEVSGRLRSSWFGVANRPPGRRYGRSSLRVGAVHALGPRACAGVPRVPSVLAPSGAACRDQFRRGPPPAVPTTRPAARVVSLPSARRGHWRLATAGPPRSARLERRAGRPGPARFRYRRRRSPRRPACRTRHAVLDLRSSCGEASASAPLSARSRGHRTKRRRASQAPHNVRRKSQNRNPERSIAAGSQDPGHQEVSDRTPLEAGAGNPG